MKIERNHADTGALAVVDGRELTEAHADAFGMLRDDVVSWGARRWQADRTPPDPIGWLWLGRSTSGEHLYWTPTPAVPSSPDGEGGCGMSSEPGHDVSRGKPRLHAQITFYAEDPIDYEAAVERIGQALTAAGFDDRTEVFEELIHGDEPDGDAA